MWSDIIKQMIAREDTINKAVEYIKEKISPDKIYLFGSYAKGTQTKDSDMDFFIIKDTNLPRPKRAALLYSLDKSKKIGSFIGMDFIVYTPKEYEERRSEKNSIVGEVVRNGKLLYERKE